MKEFLVTITNLNGTTMCIKAKAKTEAQANQIAEDIGGEGWYALKTRQI